jgi:hypothetical protein
MRGGRKPEIRNPKPETNPKGQSGNDQNNSGLGNYGLWGTNCKINRKEHKEHKEDGE